MYSFDYVIVGSGIYGLHAARRLSKKYKVCVIDILDSSFKGASYVNQARLHNGYHYPRSLQTAKDAHLYFEKFQEDFSDAIFKEFVQIYSISSDGKSKVSPKEYETFCSNVGIPLYEIDPKLYFKQGIEKAYKTLEYSFNWKIIRDKLLSEANCDIMYNTQIIEQQTNKNTYKLKLSNGCIIETNGVINATYRNVNSLNRMFNKETYKVKYELAEMILLTVPKIYQKVGLTIMDGEYISIMPFGKKNVHSLYSVKYTLLDTSDKEPIFRCQDNTYCSPASIGDCNTCKYKPKSAYKKVLDLCSYYYIDTNFTNVSSIVTPRVIDKDSEHDDARLVNLKIFNDGPFFMSVHSGKINCIYQMDNILEEL